MLTSPTPVTGVVSGFDLEASKAILDSLPWIKLGRRKHGYGDAPEDCPGVLAVSQRYDGPGLAYTLVVLKRGCSK